MLAAGTGGTVDLHLIVLGADLHILAVVLDVGDDLDGGEGGLAAGVGVEGGDAHQPVDAVFTLQESVGVLALDHNVRGLQPGLVPFQIVQDLIGEAVALGPAGVHPVEHLAPVLGLGAAGTGMEAHQGVVPVVVAGEQGLQPAAFHFPGQGLEALLQLLQHGVVVLFGGHFADGHQVVPGGQHFFVPFNFVLGLAGFHRHLLAPFRVVPEARGLLHGVKPLQLIAKPFDVQGIRQTVQGRAAVIQFLLVGIKGNVHIHLSFHQFA